MKKYISVLEFRKKYAYIMINISSKDTSLARQQMMAAYRRSSGII